MKLVILESPYAGDVRRNTEYARQALKDCLLRGEAPIASHLLYTQVLDDNVPGERRLGIEAGLAWRMKADYSVFYTDLGWSSGMLAALDKLIGLTGRLKLRAFGHVKLPSSIDEEVERFLRNHIDG